MTADDLGALIELFVKLTPAERQRLLQEAEARAADRVAPERAPDMPPPSADEHPDGHRVADLAPCPRCGLNPGPSDVYCGRCGNRVAF